MDEQKLKLVKDIQKRRKQKKLRQARRRAAAIVTLAAVTTGSLGLAYTASAKEITLTEINEFDGTTQTKVIKTHTVNVEKILEDHGYTVDETDKINIPVSTDIEGDTDIVIKRGREVTIRTPQGDASAYVTTPDAKEALAEAGYSFDDDDEIYTDGNIIELVQVDVTDDVATESIPFDVEYIEDDTLPAGETRVSSEGEEGLREIVHNVTFKNGVETGRELVSDNVTVEPKNKVIAKGTKTTKVTPPSASPSAKASDTGNTIAGMSYSKKITMTATAYSTHPSENGGYTVSAMGNPLGHGIVAVDPNVIPLGSKVYVTSADGSWSYGVASAEDTGGAIKGSKIDLCYEGSVSEVNQFGRRDCVVYILN